MSDDRFDGSEIAVVGMAGRFPGASTVGQLWRNLIAGRDAIRHFSEEELAAAGVAPEVLADPHYVRARGTIEEIERFDASFFGYNPREAELMDPQHRVFLHCAWEALEGAGYDPESFPGLVGVFASVNLSGYLLSNLYPNPELAASVAPLQAQIGNDKDYLATRVSYKLNLRGPSFTVQTACSSSLVAVHLARQSLFNEECDLALAGGVSILVPQEQGYFYQEDGIVSPDGRCRVFDAEAAGTVFGSGVALVVLKRLADALSDGDRLYAVIRGSAVNNDGASKAGYTAPSLEGQSEVILEALADAGVDAGTISYVEAHGTGTALGDPIEVAALTRAFRVTTAARGFCALGSVKSNLGHLSMASGVTGLIKTALMLRHRRRVPSLHFRQPNPRIDFAASPFFVDATGGEWAPGSAPRRAGVSAFGFGGTNVHVILEEPPERPPADPPGRFQVLLLSAKSAAGLERATANLADHLNRHPELEPADVAFTLQRGRQAFPHRRMLVCRDLPEARAALEEVGRKTLTIHQERRDRPVVFLFPGQGAQHAGMGAELYRDQPCFRQQADHCAELLVPHLGCNLRRLLFSGEVDAEEAGRQLEQTALAQPALFLVEYALAQWWMALGVRPRAMFGHSIGEYVAACLAGVFTLADALALVAERGRLMQSMPPGAMLAVPLGEEALAPYLGPGISLAAVNGPSRTVVSGPPEPIEELTARLRDQGVRGTRLHTSHAYHSEMMEPIVARFEAVVAGVARRPPEIPFLANPSGEPITAAQACDPAYWASQLRRTVRFARAIAELEKEPGRVLLEVGPGRTLSTLARAQTARETAVLASLPPPRRAEQGELEHLIHSVGRVWLAGAAIDWTGLHPGRRHRVRLPTYPFEPQRYWIEPTAPGSRIGVPVRRHLVDWFSIPVWRQARPLPRPRLDATRRWLLFIDADGLGTALAAQLEAAGQEVTTVAAGAGFEDRGGGRFVVGAEDSVDYQALVAALVARGGVPDRVVHLWTVGERTDALSWEAELEQARSLGFSSLLELIRALGNRVAGLEFTVVSSGVRSVTGEEELVPARALVLGPCRVMPQELASVRCRIIDLTPAGGRQRELAAKLLAELAWEPAPGEVALRGDRRWVPEFEALRLRDDEEMPPRLRPGGVYLVAGGLTGLGRVLSEHLARSLRPRLVMMAEAPMPESDRVAAWKALEEAGARILPLEADGSDPEAMRRALRGAEERWGRIEGAFYAPEVAGPELVGPVGAIKPAACAQLFATRARAMAILESLLAESDAGFCLVHSSLASILAGPGLVAHAAVSHLLDALVERNRRSSPVAWVSVNWDAWQLAPSGRSAATGIAPAAGTQAFRRVLAAEEVTRVIVSASDLEARLDRWVRSEQPPAVPGAGDDAAPRHARPHLGTPYVPPSDELERRLTEICQEFLGIDGIGVDDDFFDLGGDSLLATQVISRVREILEVTLSLRSLFETPSVAGMAAAVRRQRAAAGMAAETAIPRRREKGPAALSLAQERLWFLEQLDPGTGAFNIPVAVRLTGVLDRAALAGSLRGIVARHETLRTAFVASAGKPQQVVHAVDPMDLPVVDLSSLPAAVAEARARDLATVETLRPFNLTRPPLLRPLLLALGKREHILVLTMHHLVADGWSQSVLFRELVTLYLARCGGPAARCDGPAARLPELPIQYADFAEWQRRWLAGEVLDRQLRYWKNQLRDAPASLAFPSDRPRPAIPTYRGTRRTIALPGTLTPALKAAGRSAETTLFMVLLAAFATQVHRYTESRDLIIGSPIAGRNRAEVEGLIGFFVNTLALRIDLSGEPSFRQLLSRVRETTLGAFAHQDLPFAKLVEAIQPTRQLSHSPLFQLMFILQGTPPSAAELPVLTLAPAEFARGAAMFDLIASVTEVEQVLFMTLDYSTDLFDHSTAERILKHFRTLTAAAGADPDLRISDLPLLSAAEEHQLLRAWNDTAARPEGTRYLQELFETRADRHPDTVALCYEGGGLLGGDPETRVLTSGELDRRANRLAHHLRALGVGPGSMVGICLPRSLEMVVSALAILKAGGGYVPLDGELPAERLGFMIADAGVRLVVTCHDHGPADFGPQVRPLRLDEADRTIAARGSDRPPRSAAPATLAYVIYTSGSTGTPKGVMLRHEPVINLIAWVNRTFRVGPRDRLLFVTSLSFDLSVYDLFGILAVGGAIRIASREELREPTRLLEIMRRERITFWDSAPAALEQLVPFLPGAGEGGEALRLVFLSGDWIPVALPDKMRGCFPRARVISLGGATEAAIWSNVYPIGRVLPWWISIPYGRPITNARYLVLDPSLRPCPIGVPGDLYIGGDCLASGYANAAKLTAERFLPDPFAAVAGSRLYRTGDRARCFADGNLEFLGRLDHQVKIRGFRIELGEIETALERHPALTRAVVVATGDHAPGDRFLVAYVVPRAPAAPRLSELREFLREILPQPMIPATFVVLDALPLTPNGKVDRRALPAPGGERPELEQDWTAPETPAEQLLAGIWEEVLGVTGIGVHDDFFELGGHSLLATQVLSRVRETFALEFPLRTLFEAPNIAGLAARIGTARQQHRGIPPPEGVPRDRELPLSFAQERLWFLEQLDPGTARYSVCGAIALSGRLEVGILHRCLNQIVRRHESLRTTFAERGGIPRQEITPALDLAMPLVELSGLDAATAQAEAGRLAEREARRPFDLRRGPLLRVLLARLGPTEHLAVVVMHHIISDGWSLGLIVRELGTLYTGKEPAPLALQYADFAVWQRQWLLDAQDGPAESQLEWWRRQLAGTSSGGELPTDRPRPPIRRGRGARLPIRFPTALRNDLEGLARAHRVTIFMVLLAGFDLLLYRATGEDDLVVGTPVAGRNRKEIEDLIGFFVNTLALRTRVRGEPELGELLDQVRTLTLGAYEHQDLPFEKLVAELDPDRDLSRSPLFQVMLTLQNAPMGALNLPELTLSTLGVDPGTTRFDLDLQLWAGPEGIHGLCIYDTDLYDATTILRLLDHYRRLLGSLAAATSATPLSALPWLSTVEAHQLLVEGNDTPTAERRHPNLPELVAAQDPEAVALIYAAEAMSYGELNRRANQLAHHLRALGVGPEARVGLVMERSPDLVVSLLAILRAGGAYLPVDPAIPPGRIAFMLADAGVGVVVTDQAADLAEYRGELVIPAREEPRIRRQPVTPPAVTRGRDHLAYVLYTSGSTGRPKGVMVSHRQLNVYLAWCLRAYPVTGRALVHSPVSFDLTVTALLAPLAAGGTAHLLGPGAELDALAASLRDGPALALVKLTPAHLEALNRLLDPRELVGKADALILGGEALGWQALTPWRRYASATRLVNEYGPTETVVGCAVCEVRPGLGEEGLSVPIGRPIPGARLYVLSPQLRPLERGAVGELGIGGLAVARGYLNRPRLTAERFVPDPFTATPGARLFRSGDLARYRADAMLEFLGRRDHQVKLRGYRIELGEIEAALTEHPAVAQAVVLVREHDQGDQRLIAFLVAEPERAPGDDELRRLLATRLPEIMVPSAFVVLGSLPLRSTGKVDRRALAALEVPGPPTTATGMAPRTPLEEVVARIWSEVLQLERVGVDDSFSRLGGHSLLATQIISRVRDAFGMDLPVRLLFETPTVAAMAEAIERGRRAAEPAPTVPLTRQRRDGPPPLSFAQQRLWVIDQMEPGTPAYNVPVALRLRGRLDPEVLKHSLREVVRRQEILRTTFASENGRPYQVIAPSLLPDLPVIDLRRPAAAIAQAETRKLAAAEFSRPFDLALGPLLRASLVRLGDEEWGVLLTLHHIVSDAWSMSLLIDEITSHYRAFREGRRPSVPELPIQYADYAVWQQRWLRGEVLEAQLEHWRAHLAGMPTALDLPTDQPRPAERTFRGARFDLTLEAALSDDLRRLAEEQQATLYIVLLASFQLLLSRYSGQDDIVVGTLIANRNRAAIERLIGFFANTLVLRTDVSGNPTFRQLVKRVREVVFDAWSHQDLPFEMLVKELQPERELGQNPLFQVMFAVDTTPFSGPELPGLEVRPFELDHPVSHFDLSFHLWESGREIRGWMSYSTELFEAATIERMLGHFRNLLEAVAARPDTPVARLSLIGESEQQRLQAAAATPAADGKRSGGKLSPELRQRLRKTVQTARQPKGASR